MVRMNLQPNWMEGRRIGLSMLPTTRPDEPSAEIHLPWMSLIIDGLIDYGFHEEADQLVNQMMEVIINLTRSSGSFHETILPGLHRGAGQRNHILGLAPSGLYLRKCGIVIRNAGKVEILARPRFTGELEVRFQGTTIHRDDRRTLVRFADDQAAEIPSDESSVVQWKTAGGG